MHKCEECGFYFEGTSCDCRATSGVPRCETCDYPLNGVGWLRHLDACHPLTSIQVGGAGTDIDGETEHQSDPVVSFELEKTFSKTKDTRTVQYVIHTIEPLQYGRDRFAYVENLSASIARRVRDIAAEGSKVNVSIEK